MLKRTHLLPLLALLAGCNTESPDTTRPLADSGVQAPQARPDETSQAGSNPDAGAGIETVPVQLEDQGEIVLIPVNTPTRVRKRMDIGQLDASIRRVTGGIGWTEIRSGREVDLFTELSATLGVPNYIQTTSEDLTPSVLFEKFLGDAARSVCTELVERELEASPAERVLLVYASPTDTIDRSPLEIEDNLRYLLLRYHGRYVEPDSSQLNLWSWLFESVSLATGDPVKAWRTVCVGLITHPDFYSN